MSSCGGLFWHREQLIWDDYLRHRQYALTTGAEVVLRQFERWRSSAEFASLALVTEQQARMVEVFTEQGILVLRGSDRHRQEEAILANWGSWGPLARAFHYATRTDARTRYLDPQEQQQDFVRRLGDQPVPSVRRVAVGPVTRLPEPRPTDWRHTNLPDVLQRRRSVREFTDRPIPLQAFATLARTVFGVTGHDRSTGTVHRTSPSGGGRHPTEPYFWIRAVDGLAAGVYHYDGFDHQLELIAALPRTSRRLAAFGDQSWAAEAPVMVTYTSVIDRNVFKYTTPRSYRVLQLDVGHLNQTLALTATGLGLGSTFTAALRDELIEGVLGCDPASELIMGAAAVGVPEPVAEDPAAP